MLIILWFFIVTYPLLYGGPERSSGTLERERRRDAWRRNATQFFIYFKDVELAGLIHIQAADHLRCQRGHSHDWSTPFGLKGGLSDKSVLDCEVEGKLVSATVISGFAGFSTNENPVVPWVTSVFPEDLGVHGGLGSALGRAGGPVVGFGLHLFAFPARVGSLGASFGAHES